MKISKDTKNILKKIKKINIHRDCNNFEEIYKLHKESISIIKYIINNLIIDNIIDNRIKKTNIKNVTLYLLKKTNIKNIKNKELLEFIINIKNNTITNKKINEFINKNNDIITDYINNLIYKNKSKKINYILNNYSKLIISKFIPIDIQTEILKLYKYKKFQVKIDSNILYFKIFYKKNLDNNMLSILILKSLYTIFIFKKKNVRINIIIFMVKNKKKFPLYTFLGPTEINSGLTSFEEINKICIYREEEIQKVIIHEMIHALNIDKQIFLNPQNTYIENKIKEDLNLLHLNRINLNESYTEACTLILNSIFNSIFLDQNIETIINNELKFSIIQISNILSFYKIKINIKKYINNKNIKLNINWDEKTSVLSYYLLKLANIININNFIYRFMFNKINIFEYYINLMSNIKNIKFRNKYTNLDNTLKMTLYDKIFKNNYI